jgi:hypothetical protein
MIFKTVDNELVIAGKTVDELGSKFQSMSDTAETSFNKIKTSIEEFVAKPEFSYEDVNTPDKEAQPLSKESYDMADTLKQQQEYNNLLEQETTSISAEIELSKRRVQNYDELSDSFEMLRETDEYLLKDLGYRDETYNDGFQGMLVEETDGQLSLLTATNLANDALDDQADAVSKVTDSFRQDIIESKNAQKAIDNISSSSLEELGYGVQSYADSVRETQTELSNMFSRIDNASVENIAAPKQPSLSERMDTIETAPIDNLISAEDTAQVEAYNVAVEEQIVLSQEHSTALSEEIDGQLSFITAENEGIASREQDSAVIAQQTAAKYALIEAQNKELLNNVNLKLATMQVTDASKELTIETLQEIANNKALIGTEQEQAVALAQETLAALGLGEASKKASVGMKALAMAGNMIAMWAITEAIQLAVKAISKLANSVDDCKERVDNMISSYESALDTANTNASKVEEIADDYEKLSKGVNGLGENVSLTADEYSQYNDIVNEIAEMFPTLIQGWTDEGNAILSLKGNVEGLRDAYKEAQQEAYNTLIASGEDGDGNDIIKQWEDTHDTGFWSKLFDFGYDDVGGEISVSEALEQLTAIGNMTADEYRNIKNTVNSGSRKDLSKLSDVEKSIGYSSYIDKALGIDSSVTDEDFQEAKKQAKILIQTYNAEIESALSDVETLANAYLMTNDDYDKLDKQCKDAASVMVNTLSEDVANGFSSKEDVGAYVDKIVQAMSTDTKVQNAVNKLFTVDTSKMSVDDIEAFVTKYTTIIAKALNENPVDVKTRLGFGDDDTEQQKTKVKGFLKDEYDDKVGTLTADELETASKLEVPEGTLLTWDQLLEKIQAYKDSLKDSDETTISSFSDAWKDLKAESSNDDSEVKDLSADLLELAKNGELTEKALKKADTTGYFKNLGISAEEAAEKINKSVTSADQLSSMKSGISAIADVLYTKKTNLASKKTKNEGIGADTLAGFDDSIKKMDSWKNFENTLGDGTSTMEECRKAANALATEWVNSENFLAKLNKTSEKSYISMLDEMGVENAQAVVEHELAMKTERLAAQKEYAKETGKKLANQSAEEITKFAEEKGYSDDLKLALYDLALQKQLTNGTTLDFSSDINAIIDLVEKIGGATQALSTLATVKKAVKNNATEGMPTNVMEKIVETSQEEIDEAREKVNKTTVTVKPKSSSSSSTTPSSNSKSNNSNSKSKSKSSKTEIDWIARKLEALQSAIDKTQAKFENLFSLKAQKNNLNKQLQQTEKLLKANQKAATKYQAKANSYLNGSTTVKKKIKGKKKKQKVKVKRSELLENAGVSVSDIKSGKIKGSADELVKKYGSKVADIIQQYQDYYDLAQDANSAVQENISSINDLNQQKLDVITEYYDTLIDKIEAVQSKIQSTIDLTSKIRSMTDNSERGTESQYNSLLNQQSENVSTLQTKKKKEDTEYNKQISNKQTELTKKQKKQTTNESKYNQTLKAMQDSGGSTSVIKAYKKKYNQQKKKLDKQIQNLQDQKDQLETNKTKYDAEIDSQINSTLSDMLDTANELANVPIADAESNIEKLSSAFNHLSSFIGLLSDDVTNYSDIAFRKSLYAEEDANSASQYQTLLNAESTAKTNKDNATAVLTALGIDPNNIRTANSDEDQGFYYTLDGKKLSKKFNEQISIYLADVSAYNTAVENAKTGMDDFCEAIKSSAESISTIIENYYQSLLDNNEDTRNINDNRIKASSSTVEKLRLVDENTASQIGDSNDSDLNILRQESQDLHSATGSYAARLLFKYGIDANGNSGILFDGNLSEEVLKIIQNEVGILGPYSITNDDVGDLMNYNTDVFSDDNSNLWNIGNITLSEQTYQKLRTLLANEPEKLQALTDWYESQNFYKKTDTKIAKQESNIQNVSDEGESQKFDIISTYYDRIISVSDAKIEDWNNNLDTFSKQSIQKISSTYDNIYDEQKNELSTKQQKADSLRKQLGNITYGTDEWYEKYDEWQKAQDEAEQAERDAQTTQKNKFDAWTEYYDSLNEDWEDAIEKKEKRIEDTIPLNLQKISTSYENILNIQDTQLEGLNLKIAKEKELLATLQEGTQAYDDAKKQIEKDQESIYDITQNKVDTVVSAFEAIGAYYDALATSVDDTLNDIENAVSMANARGSFVGVSYYQAENNAQKEQKKIYDDKIADTKEYLEKQLALGNITTDSADYYTLTRNIQEYQDASESLAVSIAESAASIRQAQRDLNDAASERLDTLNNEADFYQTLINRKDAFDDDGKITQYGTASIALSAGKISTNIAALKEVQGELSDVQDQINNYDPATATDEDEGLQSLYERYDELTSKQYEYINACYDEEDAIASLIEDGLNAQLDALNELIDKYKETLSEAQNLRDYNNTIEEKTKSISSLQKQLVVSASDTSEEGRARTESLKVQLQDAQKDLEDTEYDKYIEDQQSMLDQLSEDYSDFIEDQLENTNALVSQVIDSLQYNTNEVTQAIKDIDTTWGTDISTTLTSMLNTGKFDTSEGGTKQSVSNAESAATTLYSNTQKALTEDGTMKALPKTATDTITTATDEKSNVNSVEYVTSTAKQIATGSGMAKYKSLKANHSTRQMDDKIYQALSIMYDSPLIKKDLLEQDDFDEFFISRFGGTFEDDVKKKILSYFYDSTSFMQKALANYGFATGGIAKLIPKGEDGVAFVRNGEGFVRPEDVSNIQDLLKTVPIMYDMTNSLLPTNTTPANINNTNNTSSVNIGEVNPTFVLENVTNADTFIKEVQTNSRFNRFMTDLVVDKTSGTQNYMRY